MRWSEKDKLDLLSKEKQGKGVTRKNLIFSSYQVDINQTNQNFF